MKPNFGPGGRPKGLGQYSPFDDEAENPYARYGVSPQDLLAQMPNSAGSAPPNVGVGQPNMPPQVDPTKPRVGPRRPMPTVAAPSVDPSAPKYGPSGASMTAPGGLTMDPGGRTAFINDLLKGAASGMTVRPSAAAAQGSAPGQEDPREPPQDTATGAETTTAAAPADDDSSWVAGLYTKYLGRDGTPAEVADWVRELQRRSARGGSGTARAYVESAIVNSREARAYQAANPNPNTDAEEGATAAAPTPEETATTTGGGRFPEGGNPAWFTGFDLGKEYEATSAKGTFMRAATASGIDPTGVSKADSEAWFTEHIQPALEAAGFDVLDVVGDRALVATTENPNGEWVDYMKAAGGGNAQFAWQSDMDSGGGGHTSTAENADGPNETDFWGATQGVNPRSWSKAQAEAWFKENVVPGLTAAGRNVEWVIGDTAKIDGVEYDFLQGADSGNAAFQWMVKSGQPGTRSVGAGRTGDQIGSSSYGQDPFLELFADPYYRKIIEEFMAWAQQQQKSSADRA